MYCVKERGERKGEREREGGRKRERGEGGREESITFIFCFCLPSRLIDVELILINEADESNDFWNLTGDKKLYHSLASG